MPAVAGAPARVGFLANALGQLGFVSLSCQGRRDKIQKNGEDSWDSAPSAWFLAASSAVVKTLFLLSSAD